MFVLDISHYDLVFIMTALIYGCFIIKKKKLTNAAL